MKIIQPARLTFWRFIFAVTAALPFLSIYQLLGRAKLVGVDFSASPSWMGLITGLSLVALFSLFLLISTWSRYREQILFLAEFPERIPNKTRWISLLFLSLAVGGFTLVFMILLFKNSLALSAGRVS